MKLETILKTSDYDRFEMHEINRLVMDGEGFSPRKDLLESMKTEGFRRASAISCVHTANDTLRIIDGHNRFITARYLGIPLYFIAFEEKDSISPLQFSTSQKLWAGKDIAIAHAQSGNDDFAEVFEYHAKTGISLMAAFSMFHGEVASSGNVNPKVRNGKFKIKDRVTPWKVASIVKLIGEFVKFSTDKRLVCAISKAVFAEGFDPEKLKEKISRNSELLTPRRTLDEYIDLLELIYNRNYKGEKYYLRVEIEKAMKRRSAARSEK